MRLVITLSLLLIAPTMGAQTAHSDTTIARIEKISSQREKTISYNIATERAWQNGEYKKALEYSDRGLKIARASNFKDLESNLHNNRGITYDFLSQYPSALKHFFAGLSIQEKLDDPELKADILGNIGLIYMYQKLSKKSLEYHNRALKIRREINDQHGISASLNNIAIVYYNDKKYHEAIKNYLECIKIDEAAKDIKGLGDDYNNIALPYLDLGEYAKSLEYLNRALEIRKKSKDIQGVSETLSNIGEIYLNQNRPNEARPYFLKAIELAKSLNNRESLRYLYEISSRNEEKAKDTIAAFKNYRLYIAYKDSIDNSAIARKQTEFELNYKFNKEKEVARLKQQEKDRQYQIILIAISTGLILILLFSILFYRKWKQTQAQQTIIEEKNALVQLKNDEIMASISYAKRIQKAILPSLAKLDQAFPAHFVLYLPKDIVSGDFYWMDEVEDTLFLAVADCTGHGVPGAMMSVVCHNALNRALREYKKLSPAELLNKTRELVIAELTHQDEAVADGMDISLCSFDKKNAKLNWSGANIPLWVYRAHTNSIEEWKADKQPIGNHRNPVPFKQHELDLDENDRIFLFSDGFQDQFGGPNEKKLMRKGFKDALLKSSKLKLNDQHDFLIKTFQSWKSKFEQVDDVCVIGVQFISPNDALN